MRHNLRSTLGMGQPADIARHAAVLYHMLGIVHLHVWFMMEQARAGTTIWCVMEQAKAGLVQTCRAC